MRRQVHVATMTISRSERRSVPQSILLEGQKREVFGLSATYPLIEVLLKINRSNCHPLLEKKSSQSQGKGHCQLLPKDWKTASHASTATHLPRSNHRLLWAQWSLQNRAHRAHGPVGVETGPVGKSTTGHKCARLEFWVAHPEISGCPPYTAHFSSNFPASYFPAVQVESLAYRQRRSTRS